MECLKITSSLVLTFLLLLTARAEDDGSSVVVVYNSSLSASKEVAQHYAAKRKVPENHLLAFDLPQTETISREQFESKLQKPLWEELKKRKLLVYGSQTPSKDKCNVTDASIRYVVLCYGVPLKIIPDPSVKEEAAEKMPAELRRNEAAVDSELSLLPLLDLKLPVTGVISNPVFLATNNFRIHPTNGVLMVARLDGPSASIAKGLVDKAIQAETEGLWGRAYFDSRGLADGPHKMGDEWITTAADAARAYGFEVIEEKSGRTFAPSAPLSDIALYFGWYDQSVSGPFTNGMAQFRPGAIAYHLHSFSSRALRTPDTWWTGPLLAAGATATFGCTEEPYLQTTVQIREFLSRMMFLRYTFGEAAYAAQPVLSWQNTIIGDPLYRPFAKNQQEWNYQLELTKSKHLEWSFLMWINFRLNQGANLAEIEEFYKRVPVSKNSAVLQEKLGDIYKSRGKLFDSLRPYTAALKLEMNPVQRFRVSLNAASLLSSLGRPSEAYEIYQDLLKNYPNYPDRKDLYERIQKVAERLNKTDEAREFERLAKEAPGA